MCEIFCLHRGGGANIELNKITENKIRHNTIAAEGNINFFPVNHTYYAYRSLVTTITYQKN